MAFNVQELNSKNTPTRWRIVGKELVDNRPEELEKLDPHYKSVLERAATFTSNEEMGVGNQPNVGSEPDPSPVLVSSVKITGAVSVLTLDDQDSVQLGVQVGPFNADDKTVIWTSSDASVATVSATGLVEAQDVGTVVITVTANDANKAKDTVSIEVLETAE